MTHLKKPDPRDFDLASFGDMLWQRVAMPGEEPGHFEAFRDGMTRELAPCTPYEAVLADHLIMIEWDLREHRRMRDAIIRDKVMTTARDLLIKTREREHDAMIQASLDAEDDEDDVAGHDGEEPDPFDIDGARTEAETLVQQLSSGDPEEIAKADRTLSDLGASRILLTARAWDVLSEGIRPHEDTIRDLERRRREVQRDLAQLQTKRPVEATAAS